MVNYTTGADLLDDVLFRAGEPTDSTSDYYDAALRYLNRAYQGIWHGGSELDPSINEIWWWLREPTSGQLTLLPSYTSGTVQVTNNSTGIVLSSPPVYSLVGYHFRTSSHNDTFRIDTHVAGAVNAIIDSVYTGADDALASYRAFKVDYTLSTNVLNIISPMRVCKDGPEVITGLSPLELASQYPLEDTSSGQPEAFALIGDGANDVQKVRFSHYGGTSATELYRIDYEYTTAPGDITDAAMVPVIPRQYRKIICDWALSFVLADKGELDRASVALGLAQSGLRAMANDHRMQMQLSAYTPEGDFSMGRIYPRGRRGYPLSPLRTTQGFIIT